MSQANLAAGGGQAWQPSRPAPMRASHRNQESRGYGSGFVVRNEHGPLGPAVTVLWLGERGPSTLEWRGARDLQWFAGEGWAG